MILKSYHRSSLSLTLAISLLVLMNSALGHTAMLRHGNYSIVAYKDYNEALKLAPNPSTKDLCNPGFRYTIHEKGVDNCITNKYGYYRCRRYITYTCEDATSNKPSTPLNEKNRVCDSLTTDQHIASWEFDIYGTNIIKMSQCAYGGSSKSGYLHQKNLSGYYVRACWEVHFKNGKKSKGCSNYAPYEEAKSSCYSCNPKASGVKNIILTCFRKSTNPNERLTCENRDTNISGEKRIGSESESGPGANISDKSRQELNNKKMCRKIDSKGRTIATFPPSANGECIGGDTTPPSRPNLDDSNYTAFDQINYGDKPSHGIDETRKGGRPGAMIARVDQCGPACDQCFQNYPEGAYLLLKNGDMVLAGNLIAAEFHLGRKCQDVGFKYCVAETICYSKPKLGITN